MGLNTYVVGFKPPDEKWQKMKAALEACRRAGVKPPKEVVTFFGDGEEPDPQGVEVSPEELEETGAVKDWDDGDMCSGFELDVSKLPKDVTIIRFINSF